MQIWAVLDFYGPLKSYSRISSAIALCVLLSSFSSFFATSLFRSLNKESRQMDVEDSLLLLNNTHLHIILSLPQPSVGETKILRLSFQNLFKIIKIQCVPIKRKPVLSVGYLHCHAIFNQTIYMLHYQGHFLLFHLTPNTWWYLNA